MFAASHSLATVLARLQLQVPSCSFLLQLALIQL